MRQLSKSRWIYGILAAFAAMLVVGVIAWAQSTPPPPLDEPEPLHETYQAQAMGQGTQLGQSFGVTIHIEQYSTEEERQVLIGAFQKGGSQGLYNALNKMHSKGRIAITGTVGYDISFARVLPAANGRKIRILTNRPIGFGEAWNDGRSMDYNLSMLELDMVPEKGKSTGTLLPACEFTVNKKTNEVEVEAFKNPWKMVDVIDWGSKKHKK
jgi:hypothetical protein